MITFGRLRRPWLTRIGCSAVVAASALAFSAPPASAREIRAPQIRLPLVISAKNFKFQGVPTKLTAGTYKMKLLNGSEDAHLFFAVNLGPHCSSSITTVSQAKSFLHSFDDKDEAEGDKFFASQCPGGSLAGDGVFAKPYSVGRGGLSITPGRVLYFCPIPEEDGTPHSDLGMIGFIKVSAPPAG